MMTRDRIAGNALAPEGLALNGWQANPQQTVSMTQCFGCWTQCGVRVRVDRVSGKVLRIAGNPYHPLSHERHIDSAIPMAQALANLSGESGLDGRDTFLRRFAQNGFGSKNFGAHGAYCGLAYRAGSGALLGNLDKNPHVKPDWDNVEFALFMGTSPAQSGNPFKRQARQLANARLRSAFRYVVVAANHGVGRRSRSLAAGQSRQQCRLSHGDDPLAGQHLTTAHLSGSGTEAAMPVVVDAAANTYTSRRRSRPSGVYLCARRPLRPRCQRTR